MPNRRLCVLDIVDALRRNTTTAIAKNGVPSLRAVGLCVASLPSPDDKERQAVMSGNRRDGMCDIITADLLIQIIGNDTWISKWQEQQPIHLQPVIFVHA